MISRGFLSGVFLALISFSPAAANRYVLSPGEHWMTATVDHRDAELTVLVYQPKSGEPLLRVLDLDELAIGFKAERYMRHRGEDFVTPGQLTRYEFHPDPLAGRAHFVRNVRPHWPEKVPADLLLDVRINGVLLDEPIYARNTGSDLVLPKESLEQLRVALPQAYGPFLSDEMPVHALAGELFHLELDRLYLEMTVDPEAFASTELSVQPDWRASTVTNWSPSVVLGYDLNGGEDSDGERWQTALGDLALSAGAASCRSRHLYRSDLTRVTRLDTACLVDWPSIPLSAGAGDHYTAAGPLQQTVAYGGFWVGTDYSLQPYRNLQPSLIVDGNARLPSTLEIWMDQRLGLRQEIPPGPFVVENLPAVTGSGELQAYLIDASGRQVLVSAPVYSDPRLLQPGVSDWRIEGGRLRPGVLVDPDNYTQRFAAASLRTGVTDWLTGEMHGEHAPELSNASVSIAVRAWRLGLFEFGKSMSRTSATEADGEATLLGYTYRGDYLHLAYREIRRDAGFVGLGYPEPGDAPSTERVASVGISAGFSSFTLTGIERGYRDIDRAGQQLVNASLSFRLGRFGQLLLSAVKDVSTSDSDPIYTAHLSIPFGRRSQFFHSVSGSRGIDRSSSGYQVSPPPGAGAGFRINRDTFLDSERYYAEANWRGNVAEGSISGQRSDTPDASTSWGARLTGAVLASRAGLGLSRDDGNSFAMVSAGPGNKGVQVLHEHQVVTETGAGGKAVVPGLRSYQENQVQLDVRDLPLASDVDQDSLVIVPGRRSVVVADYGVRSERILLARLVSPPGRPPIPAGAQLSVEGSDAGLAGFDGTIYVSLPAQQDVRLEAEWAEGSCSAAVNVPMTGGIHELGEIECHAQ